MLQLCHMMLTVLASGRANLGPKGWMPVDGKEGQIRPVILEVAPLPPRIRRH